MTRQEFDAIKPGDIILLKDTTYEEVNVVKTYFMKVLKIGKLAMLGKDMWSDYIYAQYDGKQHLEYGFQRGDEINIRERHIPALSKTGGDMFKRQLVQDLFEKKKVVYRGGLK